MTLSEINYRLNISFGIFSEWKWTVKLDGHESKWTVASQNGVKMESKWTVHEVELVGWNC